MITIEEKRNLYLGEYEKNKNDIDAKISEGIEKYRKGYCRIRTCRLPDQQRPSDDVRH